jgi:acyl-CoA synthetase (NDP forming)
MNIEKLVAPRSIAVIGASDRPSLGKIILESLGRIGFAGAVYPVNPKYRSVLNIECYPSLAELPEPPDLAAFCISSARVQEQLALAIERGVEAAVVYDGGFAEMGEQGQNLQATLAQQCREAGLALCGPNCMGILNPHARSTTYKQAVQDPEGLAGNVGFVSQSGSVCIGMLSDLRRFGFSLVVSSGNEAVVTTADYLDYLIEDPATKVIATFTETVREPERFVAALDRASTKGKPIVVLKVGQSERVRRAITSHTGGLAGEARVFSEVLRAHRAIEVRDLDEMTEVLAVCQGERWPKGPRISVVTGSGGLGELILDNAVAAGLDLPPLQPAERAEVERVVGHITGDGNPLDAWGSGNYAENLRHAMSVLNTSENIDAVVYCNDVADKQQLGQPARVLDNVNIVVEAARRTSKPYYLMSTRFGLMNMRQVEALRAEGLVMIGGRQGLGAIDRLGRYGRPLPDMRLPVQRDAPRLADVVGTRNARRTINEFDSKALLARYGIPVSREQRVDSLEAAQSAARAIGFPVVLKVLSDAIPHKTELGLVALNLRNAEEVTDAWEQLSERVRALDLGSPEAAFLIQEFVAGGVELFAGVSRDPDFGLTIAFGLGGIAIEAVRDFSLRVLPLREGDAEEMIAQTRGAALLGRLRGRPAADVKAVADCLYALADFAVLNAEHIAEIDLNPIKAGPNGCVVVDALIVCKSQEIAGD